MTTESPLATPLRIALWGASGRMGRMAVREIAAAADLVLAAAICSPQSPHIGADAGELAETGPANIALSEWPPQDCRWDVLLDLSLPEGSLRAVQCAAEAGTPAVVGATGFNDGQQRQLQAAAAGIPLLQAPNFSLLVGVLLQLLQQVRAASGGTAEISLAETHHRHKRDLPSGTARALAGRSGLEAEQVRSDYAPEGDESICTYRIDIALPGEKQTLFYKATDRRCFALGALRACRWLVGRPVGLYDMDDLLNEAESADTDISAANS